ncbi:MULTISPECIES: methyltransferase type 12 [Thalassospira]|uniref:Methyltransferase type 12 n=2 Tax=Thalassospira TaxID=168934 RepID=A0A367WH07_9PROT|nr:MULTISPECIES: methyltransferase type 12 [Thalassospira]MDG4718883.1 methyltransferase type 12 [Thalassospira sp. FZY0004]RCK39851.1 methyltransferase type 12 [Thalassospira profundimaris]
MTSQALSEPRKYPVNHIWHADWSISVKARWVAKSRRKAGGWQIHAIEPVGMLNQFRQSLADHGRNKSIWLGLDMPIGFAGYWYDGANIQNFKSLLKNIFSRDMEDFPYVCETPDQITYHRPFYPKSSGTKGSVKRDHLVKALGLSSFDELHRRCERATDDRAAACPSFWTLGANQVGKGMLHGLEHLIIPGARDGFNIWPFDGDLAACCQHPGVTLMETYPGEVYGWLGISELTKSNQQSRANAVASLINYAARNSVEISPAVIADIQSGFGPEQGKDDAFDALVGVLGLIQIADGKRPEHLPDDRVIREREGWIIGMDGSTLKTPPKAHAQ